MKKLIAFIKHCFIYFRLRCRGIDLSDFKNCIKYTKFLESMSRSDFSLFDYFELHYENIKK